MADFGNQNYDGSASWKTGSHRASPATPSTSGVIQSATGLLWVDSGVSRIRFAIYSDRDGFPDTLLAKSDIFNVGATTPTWYRADFTGTERKSIVAGTPYWLVVIGDISNYTYSRLTTVSGGKTYLSAITSSADVDNPPSKFTVFGGYGSTTQSVTLYITYAEALVISPASIPADDVLGEPTITTGPVTVSPSSIPADDVLGEPTVVYNVWDVGGIPGDDTFGTPTITQGDPPPPGEIDWSNLGTESKKEFMYKVYEPDGTPVGIWTDVRDDLEFSQAINTPGTTTTVILSRSANRTRETRDAWVDHNGEQYVDHNGEPYVLIGQTSNTVGEGTDVQRGYLVDVYAFYGGYEEWVDHNGEPYVDHNGDPYILSTGAPMGRRVFSGYIMDYSAAYGDTSSVTVTLASHGSEFSKQLVRSGETTSVTYSTTAIETILKEVIDTNPGKMTWSNESIDATGSSITAKFQLNTKFEAIKSLYDQTSAGWYWYGDVGENTVYLKQASATADHVFMKGKHIGKVDIKLSMENLINTVYVVGGDSGGTTLFKKYVDAASVAEFGTHVHRITDRRITLETTAQRYAEKILALYSQPVYTTPVTISSGAYDIESIKLGQMVRFGNFGNYLDSITLQIVNRNYTPRAVTLQLGSLLERQVDITADLEEGLQNEQFQEIPNAPS